MWFKKPKVEELKPGICECDHERCHHVGGKGKCRVDVTEETPKELRDQFPQMCWTCACQIFILDEDGGSDKPPETPIDPEIVELKKLAGMS